MGEGAQEAPTLVWARREPRRRTWRTCRTWLTVRAADLIDSGESRASPVESSAALFSTAQTISVQVRPALCRSSTQVKQRHHDDDEVPRRPTGRQIFSSEQPKDMPTADHIFLFCCVCVCVCVRVRVGFWVAMADQGQTPGRPLVTTSAGRSSNTLRGPSGSWPGKFTKPQTCTSRRAKRQPNRRHQLTCHSGRWLERPPCAKRVHGKPP